MMITLPLYILLFAYFGFLAIFVIFAFINLLHIVRTGSMTMASFVITFICFAATIFTLFATWTLLQGVDWQERALIWDSAWFSGISDFTQFSP